MRGWIAASFLFFAYVMLVAPLVRGLPAKRRALAAGGSCAGLLICAAAHLQPHSTALHDWFVPPVLLLIGYWSSGLLFAAPMPRADSALETLDRAFRIERAAAAAPRWLAELLELAYIGVYPLIPVALVVHVLGTASSDPERFWTVILLTDYVCFAFLPWVQTRPPRACRAAAPWRSRVRAINLRLLGKTSIHVNTFPSGHAAEALATTLLVVGAPVIWVGALSIGAVLISAGAVLGRYHYAADVLTGWVVAVCVWMLV